MVALANTKVSLGNLLYSRNLGDVVAPEGGSTLRRGLRPSWCLHTSVQAPKPLVETRPSGATRDP